MACEIITLEPPEFVSSADLLCVLPTSTEPKPTLEGLATSWPGATPVPESDTGTIALVALLAIEIVPVASPAAEGVKAALNVTALPAATVTGRLGALRENADALDVAPLIVTEAVPLFVAVTVRVLLLPTTTLPKLSDELLKPSSPVGCPCCCDGLLVPKP